MYADRIKHLPPYLFAAIDKAKQEARARGVDVIDLSVGDPDLPTPEHIVEALNQAARDSIQPPVSILRGQAGLSERLWRTGTERPSASTWIRRRRFSP